MARSTVFFLPQNALFLLVGRGFTIVENISAPVKMAFLGPFLRKNHFFEK